MAAFPAITIVALFKAPIIAKNTDSRRHDRAAIQYQDFFESGKYLYDYREWEKMAGLTGLEPATSGVTGQRCNQLYYNPAKKTRDSHIPLRCKV